MTVTFYGSFDEMMDDLGRAMQIADSHVRPAQESIQPGQCYINYKPELGFFIFGEILDHKTLGYDKEEQDYIDQLYSEPHMRFYKPVKAYSVACPMGEGGDLHLSDIDAVIDKRLFNWYKQHNWVKPEEP